LKICFEDLNMKKNLRKKAERFVNLFENVNNKSNKTNYICDINIYMVMKCLIFSRFRSEKSEKVSGYGVHPW